jgi:hypothetical protein
MRFSGFSALRDSGFLLIYQARPNRGPRATAGSRRLFPWLATDFANILQLDINRFLKKLKKFMKYMKC